MAPSPNSTRLGNKEASVPSTALAHPLEMRGVHGVLVVVHDTARDALLEHVHLGARKIACRHALLEEHVHLGKRAARWLGHTEVRVDDAAEADAGLSRLSVSV